MEKIIRKYSNILPYIIMVVTVLGVVYMVIGPTSTASYWSSIGLFIVGSILSVQSAATKDVNSLLENFKEVIIGSVNIGLRSIKQIEELPPAQLAENTVSKFQFIGVAGSKFLEDVFKKGDFFRTNGRSSNVQIILMDPYSDELKRLSKKTGGESVHRRKIIESIKFLKKLREDGYQFDVRLYPKLPPLRLMICDGRLTTISVYSADSSGWKNAQLVFDAEGTPDSIAPHFEYLFNDLWERSLTINLNVRSQCLDVLCDNKYRHALGMVHGRFQPFHHEHLEYVLWGISNSKKCVIAITQPNIECLSGSVGAPHRSKSEGNPFTFDERKRMIFLSLDRLGVSRDRYCIVPFDVDNMEDGFKVIEDTLGENCKPVQYVKIFSEWEVHKVKEFEKLGYDVEEIQGSYNKYMVKNVTGTLIREMVSSGRNWKDYVPYGTQKVIGEVNKGIKGE